MENFPRAGRDADLPSLSGARPARLHHRSCPGHPRHEVAYERLLLPFSDNEVVNHVIASVKMICEDGGFEIRNLMRDADKRSQLKVCALIDRDLFHRTGRATSGEIIEFS
jgi:hypothetical protein